MNHAQKLEMTDEEKHRYAVMILWKDYVARPPADMKNIVIAGIGSDRFTSTNKLQGEMMLLLPDNTKPKKMALRRLVMQESALNAKNQLVQYAGYTVKLGEFAAGGDLVADDRADFSKPKSTGLTFEKLMDIVGAVRVPSLVDVMNYPSKKLSTGYPDSTDWKIVRGLVDRVHVGDRKDKKTKFGVYNVIDTSLGDKEPELTDDGQIIRPGFTIWIAPELAKHGPNSLIDFAGPISVDKKKKQSSMTAYATNAIISYNIEGDNHGSQ